MLWLKYRSEAFVYLEILTELAMGSIGPTKLSRRVNISYDRLPPLIDKLISLGAVKKEPREGHDEYILTPVGAQWLSNLEKVRLVLE